eukprot:TRINITY_DN2724_c0_g1_i2.p1 TRINITY_DN2724_c0_g1~~TRINITY_DN2724_c0_g1_i2.p1  ORF type:complete len:113 (-),score=20.00 TRINITY_DN2724_c0_g1_i2:98-436(-)
MCIRDRWYQRRVHGVADETYSIAVVFTDKNYCLNMLRGYKQDEDLNEDEYVNYVDTDKSNNDFVLDSKIFGAGFRFLNEGPQSGHVLYFVVSDINSSSENLMVNTTMNRFKH